MVRSYYEQGTHVVLVDVGHSYKGLCQLVKGYYFTYEEKESHSFQSLSYRGRRYAGYRKKESIKTLLLALWKKDNETFNRSGNYVALSNALQLYYTPAPEGKRKFSNALILFYEFLQTDFVEVLKRDEVKKGF